MPLGLYPGSFHPNTIPTSDAAGVVLAVGSAVTEFRPGDRVCNTFFLDFSSGYPTPTALQSSLGGLHDGMLRKHAVVPEKALVHAPSHLSMVEASTLPCAGLTAWNALFGLEGRVVKEGDWVLTQGTGGVSLFAAQFAIAVGARVVGTTGQKGKEGRLRKSIGVEEVVNYREVPEWGGRVKELVGGVGVQHVIEVGGEGTMKQSLRAVAPEGVVSIIGFLSGGEREVGFWDAFRASCVVRGINVGSRAQFQEMNRFIEEKRIVPVVDEKVFGFEEARKALEYLQAQQFFGKVVIKVVDV